MGKDYYAVLGVRRGCDDECELKKAYRRLAMKFHPDKTQLDKQDCEQRFKEVMEAYEVLSDARKKAAYDRWGDAGVSGTHTAFFATAFSASPGDTPSAKRPHPCPASSAFAGFAACSSAFQHNFQQEFFSTFSDMFSGDAPQAGQPCAPGRAFPGAAAPPVLKKDAAIEVPLHCTLEELYQGTTKRMRVDRAVPTVESATGRCSEVLTVQVMPGWRAGTRVTFPEKGDVRPGRIPADVVFVVEERPHPSYVRDGADLVYTHRLALVDALCGCTALVPTLDGRELALSVQGVVAQGAERLIPGEGMPLGAGARGDLRVRFDVQFPPALDAGAREMLRAALPPGPLEGEA
ncbi:hypothetical protein ACKKBF_B37850 [Auxenochlorella protothecoides x Auxenochlorella symbiontica]